MDYFVNILHHTLRHQAKAVSSDLSLQGLIRREFLGNTDYFAKNYGYN
jgi:hypothetical protein